MQCWNRPPQEAVTPPSLKVPKTVLDHGQLGLVFMTVPTGWRPNKSPHKSPPLKISRILWYDTNWEISMLWKITRLAKDSLLPKIFSVNQFQSVDFKGHCHQTTGKLRGLLLYLFDKNNLSYTWSNVREPAKVQLMMNKMKHEFKILFSSLKTKQIKTQNISLEKYLTFKQDDQQLLSFCETITPPPKTNKQPERNKTKMTTATKKA